MREAAVAEEALGRLVDGWRRKPEHVIDFARGQAAVTRTEVEDPSTCPLEICSWSYVEGIDHRCCKGSSSEFVCSQSSICICPRVRTPRTAYLGAQKLK